MADTDQLERVNALTSNARNTWFILLTAIIFVGITMLGVQPIDFYGVSRNTELPLVGVSVPMRLFFYAAPILTVAVYGYFHLYLVRLWDALSDLDAKIDGRPVSDLVNPWLVTDTALTLRRWLRDDGCCERRALEVPSVFWNIVFAWLAGPIVLIYVWYQSLPARDVAMSGMSAAMFVFSIIFGLGSATMLVIRMKRKPEEGVPDVKLAGQYNIIVWVTLTLLIASSTAQKTVGPRDGLARLDLTAEDIVERPAGWLPYDIARKDFLAVWCRREDVKPCTLEDLEKADRSAFDTEWNTRRAAQRGDLRKPLWHEGDAEKPDFRDALLSSSFLAGANLREAQMEGADFSGAQMEGADLPLAQMDGADLSGAQMEGVLFGRSELTGTAEETNVLYYTNLIRSTNNGSPLRFVDLTYAIFDTLTDWRNVFLDGSAKVTQAFRTQMGEGNLEGPCQWVDDHLDDAAFFGYWRGWIEAAPGNQSVSARARWERLAPDGFEDVEAIAPDQGCTWKTGPMPVVQAD